MKNVKLRIYGKVHRIGFRFSAMQKAYHMGVNGFVQNVDDGSVYIEAEGEEENLRNFMDWCKVGPLGARIDKILMEDGIVRNYTSFDIRTR
ncbi:MAG: acylphosphatase [Bacteroidetes bacterium]|nr:acylphosphatase [Bacteroidota bacterium]